MKLENTIKPVLPENFKSDKARKNKQNTTDDEFRYLRDDQFIIRESESKIGTNDYKIWNRISLVLDRLDKDRFGELPPNVKRTKKGLAVTFMYSNGVRHDIYWTKGGQVVIKVSGVRSKNISGELSRAYESLFKLTHEVDI